MLGRSVTDHSVNRYANTKKVDLSRLFLHFFLHLLSVMQGRTSVHSFFILLSVMQGRSASACMNRLKESRDAGKVWCTPDSTTNSNGPPKVSNLHTKVICRVTPSTQLRQSELAQIKCNLCNESVFISSKDSHRFQRHHRAIQTLHYGTAYILEEKVIIIVFIVILFGACIITIRGLQEYCSSI